MRDMMRKTAVLAGAVLLVSGCALTAKAEVNQDTVEKVQAKQEYNLQQVSILNRKNIDSALKLCERNGAIAAKYLNKIKDNKHDFETGVREILNEYYSMEKSERGELDSFEEILDDSAATIIAHYAEAEEERENSDNLDYQTEEVMVSFPYGTSQETIEKVVQECAVDYEVIDSGELEIDESLPDYKKKRLEKIKDYKTDIVILAKLGLEDTVARAEEKFEEYGCVVDATDNTFLEADGIIQTASGKITTNDPQFNENDQWYLKILDLPKAYKKFQSERSATEIWVAVIDCGVQMNHPDLKGNVLTRYSVDVAYDGSEKKKLIDCEDKKAAHGQYTGSHGTSVAGVIAAKANNGKFGAGVASTASLSFGGEGICKIMAIKCDDTVKKDRHVTKAYLGKAIKYAVDSGAEVINISFSEPVNKYESKDFKSMDSAIQRAIKADVCVVASAGNDGSATLRYPAAFPGVIGVGASMPNNAITSYSNRSTAVDILAPVGDKSMQGMLCLYPTTMESCGYKVSDGTSYAAPQVAATAALMKDLDYDLTPEDILSKILSNSTTVKVTVNGQDRSFKVLNTGKAVQAIK